MDKRTRISRAIKRLPVDQLPCAELIINDELIQAILAQEDIGFAERFTFINDLGLDAVCLHPVYNIGQHTAIDAKDVEFCDLADWVNTDLFTFAVLDGPVGWAGRILGFEQMLMQMARSTQEFCKLVSNVEAMNKELIEQLSAGGINGILLADDIAFHQGVIARPALLRKTIFPSLTAQVEHAHKLGLPVVFHSDGKLTTVLDDIAAAGFDGLQCLDELAGMDIGEVKQQYGDRLCLWGNLDPAWLINLHSLSELEQAVERIIAVSDNCSGMIFGTSSGLFENMRADSLKAVYPIAKRQSENRIQLSD